MRTPKNVRELAKYLRDEFDVLETLCKYGPPDVRSDVLEPPSTGGASIALNDRLFVELEVANTVENACRLTCRFGGLLACEPQTITEPRKGLEIIGRLLAWAESQTPLPELLTVEGVADMLGVSARTVWRRVSAGEIPEPIQMGGLTKWRRADMEEFING